MRTDRNRRREDASREEIVVYYLVQGWSFFRVMCQDVCNQHLSVRGDWLVRREFVVVVFYSLVDGLHIAGLEGWLPYQ